jgi:TRADD-N domain-containing protein
MTDSAETSIEAVPTTKEVQSLDESGLAFSETKYSLQLRPTLSRLSTADPKNVQEVVASQLELMSVYHLLVLDQAKRSFKWALIAAGVGLLFFISAVSFIVYRQQLQDAAIISVISGGLIELISAINFYLYWKTAAQMADFQSRLDITQRYLLANSICEGLEGDYRQQRRSELVQEIAKIKLHEQASERPT